MKKIGIVTIIDNDNYGNRLQNYALQETIKKYGFKVTTLNNYARLNNKEKIINRIKSYIVFSLGSLKKYIKSNKKRLKNFKKFNKEYINLTNKIYTPYTKNLNNQFDAFVVGSDQVWKPIFNRMRDFDFLSFADKEKRISYAASFGISEIPEEYKSKLINGLKDFDKISVREEQGARIIKNICNKEAKVVLDPTLLLPIENWKSIERKPEFHKSNNYILTYFLDYSSYKNVVEEYAKNNGLEVINLMDKKSKYYECGPSEFLYLFHNAKMILTDSFHACVFSILYKVPFYIFNRNVKNKINNMNSRIETLLTTFNLEDRKYNDESKLSTDNCNFDYVDAILKENRSKSIDFLKSALEIGEINEG